MIGRLTALVILAAAIYAADSPKPIEAAEARFEQAVTLLPLQLRLDFRFQGADVLLERYPALAAKLVRAGLTEMREQKDVTPAASAIRTLAAVDADAAAALAPGMKIGARQGLIRELVDTHHPETAIQVFRATAKEFDAKTALPSDIWSFLNCVVAVAPASANLAADNYERIAKVVAARDFGDDPRNGMRASFSIGSTPIETKNAQIPSW